MITGERRGVARGWLLAGLMGMSGGAHAGSIDSATFCVTDDAFHVTVELSSYNEDTFDLVLGVWVIGTFMGAVRDEPNEVIRMNIDRQTCEVTRQAPLVRAEFLPPDGERLVPGLIDPSQFTLTSIGDGRCRFEGSIVHGANRFQPGDVVPEVWFREFEPYVDTRANNTEVTTCRTDLPVGIFKDGFE